jgi:hypothetical protein
MNILIIVLLILVLWLVMTTRSEGATVKPPVLPQQTGIRTQHYPIFGKCNPGEFKENGQCVTACPSGSIGSGVFCYKCPDGTRLNAGLCYYY